MKKLFLQNLPVVLAMILAFNIEGYSQANTSLSNLVSPTSVNQSLIPSSTNTKNLGSSTLAWKDGWFMGKLSIGSTATPTTMLDIMPPTTSTGAINLKPNSAAIPSTSELRFSELSSNGTNYVGFKAPSSISANKIWILPSADGTNGQVLSTNGSGTLSWATASGGTSVTANYIPRSDGTNLITGSLYDNGTKIGLGTSSPSAFLQISKSGDSDNPHLLIRDVNTDGYARIYLNSFTNMIGDESKWKILGRTSQTDANNEFYIQQVKFINGDNVGYTRFYINSNGKTGIGTSAPTANLHVNSTPNVGDKFIVGPETGTPLFVVGALGQSGLGVTNPNSRLHINADAGEDALRVQVNSTTKLFVSSNGGVSVGGSTTPPVNGLYVTGSIGLGTSSPAVKLHISGTDEVLRLDGTNPYMQFFSGGTALSYIQQTGNDFKLGTVGTNTSGKVQITAGTATVMTLKSSGKVGIGTTAPSSLLHLKTSNEALRLEGTDVYIGFYSTTVQKAFIQRSGDNLKIASNSGNIIFGNNVTGDQLFILSDGRIGMGTSTPKTGYKLSVEGKVVCRELKVETNTWPDYVFAPEYNLMPLTEVENFISQNNHLPGMASASEMQENGIAVGEMQNKLVEKVEELTLYVIDLQKQNNELKAQMIALQKH